MLHKGEENCHNYAFCPTGVIPWTGVIFNIINYSEIKWISSQFWGLYFTILLSLVLTWHKIRIKLQCFYCFRYICSCKRVYKRTLKGTPIFKSMSPRHHIGATLLICYSVARSPIPFRHVCGTNLLSIRPSRVSIQPLPGKGSYSLYPVTKHQIYTQLD